MYRTHRLQTLSAIGKDVAEEPSPDRNRNTLSGRPAGARRAVRLVDPGRRQWLATPPGVPLSHASFRWPFALTSTIFCQNVPFPLTMFTFFHSPFNININK